MTMAMQVAVPYWYYVKKLGRRIVRYSKIMAHDEGNSANVSSLPRHDKTLPNFVCADNKRWILRSGLKSAVQRRFVRRKLLLFRLWNAFGVSLIES